MHILAIETTGPYCSAALIDEKNNIYVKNSDERLNHLTTLMPMVKELLTEHKIEMTELDAIAASVGPGSFTGIRIGVTTARGIAQVLDKECIAVPTLYAFARGLRDACEAEKNRGAKTAFCPMFDARRKQIYSCCLTGDEEAVPAGAYDPDVFFENLENAMKEHGADTVVFAGDGVSVYGKHAKSTMENRGFKVVLEENRFQEAGAVAKTAMEMYQTGRTVSFEKLKPEYMRKPEAQRRLEERLKDLK